MQYHTTAHRGIKLHSINTIRCIVGRLSLLLGVDIVFYGICQLIVGLRPVTYHVLVMLGAKPYGVKPMGLTLWDKSCCCGSEGQWHRSVHSFCVQQDTTYMSWQ